MRIGEAAAARLVALTDAADAAAQNNLGVVLQRGGRTDDAQEAFDRAVALDGGMAVARRNLRTLPDDVAVATTAARWARVRADATDADAWRALVRHHTARGEFDTADAVLARWDATAAAGIAPAVERARWALDAGHPDVALAAVARARAGAGAHARAGDVALFAVLDLLDARAAYQRGDAAGALAAVERVRAVTPDDAEAELLRSFVLGELGAAQAAAASRSRAATLDPALARVDAGVAVLAPDAQADASGPDEAESRECSGVPARTGRVSDATSADRALAVAAALRHKGYYREALAVLATHRSARDGGTRAAVLLALGTVHLQCGAAAEAGAALAEAYKAARGAAIDAAPHAVTLAAARLLAGDADAADALARGVAHANGPALVRAGAMCVRALVAWRGGDLSTARAHLLDAAAVARTLDDVVRAALAANLALLLAEVGAATAAVSAGAAAVRLAPNDAAAHAAHARALSHAGDHGAARDAFARACVFAPQDAAVRYGLAFAAGACGDAPAARDALARATALSPVVRASVPRLILAADVPILLPSDGSGVAATYARADDVEAIQPRDATRTPPTDHAHDYAHVDARLAAGEYGRALAAANAALARGAPRAGGLARAGHALAGSGHLTLALDRYRDAAAESPTDPDAELHVVRALFRLGRLGETCERAAAAVVCWPAHPAFAAVLARAAADRGAVDVAAGALERCARARRDRIAAGDPAAFWADVACAWQALGAWDAAAEAWTEASRAIPALPRPAIARARALARAGRTEAAEALLQEVADRVPELPDVWRARAELAMAAGRLPDARAHLARVVGRDAGDVDALAALAAACVDAGHLDDAQAAASHALSLDAEHPLALAVAGDCAAARGDVGPAGEAWRRALAVSPVGAGAARARTGLRVDASQDGRSRQPAAAAIPDAVR